MQQIELNDKKVISGWAFFDWANSAYFLVISTAIFPIYYVSVAPDDIRLFGMEIPSSVLYSYSVSFAYMIVAVLSPLLAGIADYGGRRKYFMKLFTVFGSIACIGLFFFNSEEMVWLGTTMFILATIGAAGGIVFYNAYLPEIVTEDLYDRVSAKGYMYGYFGSVLLLIFCLLMVNKPEWFGITSTTLPARISFVLVGLWWIGFAQITFRRLPADIPKHTKHLFSKGVKELQTVWKKLKKQPNVLRFLASFFFYMAGVQTVIYLATIFATKELNFDTSEIIAVVLLLQLVAILGAWFFARISERFGNKLALQIQIAIWMAICLGAYFVEGKPQFYVIAGLVGLVLGGIQSLSRSTFAKLLEDRTHDLTSYFSFYDVLFKLSLVAGTIIFGLVEQLTGGIRNSLLALTVLFIIGMVLMVTVDMRHLKPTTGMNK